MKISRRHILAALLATASITITITTTAVAAEQNHLVRLATTTSTDNSGLLEVLLPQFKRASGYTIQVLAVGTGKALQLGENGDVDVLLVHAPHSEQQFVARQYGIMRKHIMSNDFIVVGPPSDPAKLQKAVSVADAFNRLQQSESLFISRGDNSGTHKKELSLWTQSGITEWGNWRLEIGQGMGRTLQVADELQGYLLIDRGTWLALQPTTSLKLLYQNSASMHNPYHAIAVNPQRHATNSAGALAFIEWLTSPPGQAAIGNYRQHGVQLFKPARPTTPVD